MTPLGVGAMPMSLAEQLRPFEEEARHLKGWVLQYQPEPIIPGPPWNYEARARRLLAGVTSVLDLGTGGGEVLKRIVGGFEGNVVATEEYHVNAPIASKNLSGVADVVRCSSEVLPFSDRSFDLVLSRHTSIAPAEVGRVLRDGGRLLTQQVVPDYLRELSAYFPSMTIYPDHFRSYCDGLREAGLNVSDASEFRTPARFGELGHLVYMLVAAPWTVPGFSVETHESNLQGLQDSINAGKPLEFTIGCYIIEAAYGD